MTFGRQYQPVLPISKALLLRNDPKNSIFFSVISCFKPNMKLPQNKFQEKFVYCLKINMNFVLYAETKGTKEN